MVYKVSEGDSVMSKSVVKALLFVLILTSQSGCTLKTEGSGSWEFCIGVRTEQISKEPAEAELKVDLREVL